MKTVNFPQANANIAEDQHQYHTVPAWVGQVGNTPEEIGVVCKVEFSAEDMANILANQNCLWLKMLTFGMPMQPFMLSAVKDVFVDEDDRVPIKKEDFEQHKDFREFKIKKFKFWDRVKILLGWQIEGLVQVVAYGHLHTIEVTEHCSYTLKD